MDYCTIPGMSSSNINTQPPPHPTLPNRDARTKRPRPRPMVSCFECRRKKLKCDRLHPCMKCKNSGRSALCSYSENAVPVTSSEQDGAEAGRRVRRRLGGEGTAGEGDVRISAGSARDVEIGDDRAALNPSLPRTPPVCVCIKGSRTRYHGLGDRMVMLDYVSPLKSISPGDNRRIN